MIICKYKGFNQEQPIDHLQDRAVSRIIRGKLPAGIFESIGVVAVTHTYLDDANRRIILKSRKITLTKPSPIFWCRAKTSIDASLIKKYLLGDILTREERDKVELQLRMSHVQLEKISLFISDDCNYADIHFNEQSQDYLADLAAKVKRIAYQIFAFFLKLLIA